MTPKEFREARKALGLTQSELSREWGYTNTKSGGRMIGRWECGEAPLHPIAAYAIKMMIKEEEK